MFEDVAVVHVRKPVCGEMLEADAPAIPLAAFNPLIDNIHVHASSVAGVRSMAAAAPSSMVSLKLRACMISEGLGRLWRGGFGQKPISRLKF